MRPAPITPRVRPVSPIPMLSMRSFHRFVRVSRSLSMSLPASARMKVSAMVATGRGIGIGVLVTSTPACVIAGTSTESKPTPWRATTRKR